jgi:hypothetical protein
MRPLLSGWCLALAVVGGPVLCAEEFLLGSPAERHSLQPGLAPAESKLYGFEVTGPNFAVYARRVPAGPLTIELGFADVESTHADERVFAVAANGVPLDASLDVWKQAGGPRPWVMRSAYDHAGGMLSLAFSGLQGNAILSYARAVDDHGRVVAFGTAEQWSKAQRLRAEDARSRAVRPVKAGEVKFFNVDHSPMGAWSTFVYGMEASGGVQVANKTDRDGNLMPHAGLVVITRSDAGTKLMPFVNPRSVSPGAAALIPESEVARSVGPATDHWEIGNGVAWTHYTPAWAMKDYQSASPAEQRRFALPATWMTWVLDNRAGQRPLQVVFSLQQPAVREGAAGPAASALPASSAADNWAGLDGYIVDRYSAIAVRHGAADLLSASDVKRDYGVANATSAFRFAAAPGERKSVTLLVAHFIPGDVSVLGGEPLRFMHAALFSGFGEVLNAAADLEPAAIRRSRELDALMAHSGIGPERQLLSADALHSYLYNTVLWQNETSGLPVFGVEEGECRFINTLDLTIDNLFYELAMHPWTVRNELDTFMAHYAFTDQVRRPGAAALSPGGLGFYHDMGTSLKFADPAKGQAYSALMTQEELQNWLCCAGIYWHETGDGAWLKRNRDVFLRGFQSMLQRDDVDPSKRDGITSFQSFLPGPRRRDEITTYDAMDHSLQQPTDSLYISVKSFGTYLVLAEVFAGLGEPDLARQCQLAGRRLSGALLARWDPASRTFPATFDGKTDSKIIPAIEGLLYPYAMGRSDLVSTTGPYARLISALKAHLESILVPGVCLDTETGGWVLSSTSTTTWESKVYLNQFIAESVLGLRDQRTGGRIDQVHLGYQVLGAPAVGWTCQFTNRDHLAFGCRHYPRGVTSALWWLSPLRAPSAR